MISIENISNTRIIVATVTSTDPQEAKDVANALADETVKVLPDVMQTAVPSIAEQALLPARPSSPSYSRNIMVGALLGLVLVAGIFTIFYLLDDTMKSAEDVEKALGIMPLTVIPEGDIASISDKKEMELEKERRKRSRQRRKEQKKGDEKA
jgi:capsular polysaccharide biosynthesis protein